MHVTLKLTFPAGRYHATPWGRHVNEGVPEWPPSPWRLLRALVATWRRKCPDLSETSVRRVLEQLISPPMFHLPPARVAHTRHAMPTNQLARNYKPSNAEKKAGKYQGDPTIVFDTFVAVGRRNPVIVHWPDATLSHDDTATLARLTENLTTLGRAEGWIHAEPVEQRMIEWNCVPSATTGTEQELVSVFCPDPATAFGNEHYPPRPDARKLRKGLKPNEYLFDCPCWHLCLDTEIIQAERWPQVPGARWVSYARRADAFTQTAAPTTRNPDRRGAPTVARFLLDGPVLPLVTDTVRVAEAFRVAAMSRFRAWCRRQRPAEVAQFLRPGQPDQYSSPILSGKDGTGDYRLDHDHAHYLPTAEGDDPQRVTHVSVYARGGFEGGETAALTGLRQLQVADLQLRAQLVGLGQPADFRAELFGESRLWTSATPYVGPAHIGRFGSVHDLRKAARREMRRWAAAQPNGIEVELVEAIPDTHPTWSGRPRPFEFVRRRSRAGDNGYLRPIGMFRVTFSKPVIGPLCLGYACHFGLGLFLPG